MRISDWSSDVCSSDLLILEAIPHVPRPLIAETIDVIVVLTGRGSERRLSELVRVEGLDAAGAYRLVPILASQGASACSEIKSEERRVGKACVMTCRYRC